MGNQGSTYSGEVRLRDVAETDLPIFYEQQRDPIASQMAAFPTREREAFLGHWAKILANTRIHKKTILFDGQVAGNIVSFEASGEREVGYWIGREFWGQGIATRALAAFLGMVRERPLYAHVARHNHGSRRVLEKCGFVVIGEDRSPFGPSSELVEEFILKLNGEDSAWIGSGDR